MLILLACEEPPVVEPDDESFSLEVDETAVLPYAVAGETVPEGSFEVWNRGGKASEGEVSLRTPSTFSADGDTSPLGPDEIRSFTLRYIGSSNIPGIYTNSILVEVDDQVADVEVAAVIGDPEIPEATWTEGAWGLTTTIALPSAPFPYEGAPYDDPSVLIFVPTSLTDEDGVNVAAHLHGHNATLAEIVADHHLVEQHAFSGRDAVLIVPQGPEEAADSDFGRLDTSGGFATLVRDVLTVMFRDGLIARPEAGMAVVTAHSGGYSGTANIVTQGAMTISAVHLFDALYGYSATFEDFAVAGGTLRSSYTDGGGTDDDNRALASTLAADGVTVGTSFSDDDLAIDAVTIGRVDVSHSDAPNLERAWARWMSASGLPARPAAPPEILSVVSDGTTAVVTWREDGGAVPIQYRVEGSMDGQSWTLLKDTNETTASVTARPWIRVSKTDVSWGNSDPSDVYGGSGADWLVVDGFDRVLDGSWTEPTHDFAAVVGNALGADFSVASNESVASGDILLSAYDHVVWLLGDEGTLDLTFDDAEQAAIEAYLDGGGSLVVSGAEVGYATDSSWLSDTLHVTYVSDDAGTVWVEGFTIGQEYDEDYPDVLSGNEVLWAYGSGQAAAVGWDNRIIVVGFGLENIQTAQRSTVIHDLVAWLQ